MSESQEKMDKQIIVIGDIEMGAGNLTDDFIADHHLSKTILEFSDRNGPIDLILNGDTFDFLKCPSTLTPKTDYPRHITAKVSLEKLRLIYQAHKRVFKALSHFVSKKGKKIYFILGNHDHDLVYSEVQKKIQEYLGNSEDVIFPGLIYRKHKVYVEHGQQYDLLFKINFEKLFMKHKGESILNFPFFSFGLLGRFMHYKEEHPFIERIFPRPTLLTHHRVVAKKLNIYTVSYFLKSLIYYPFRFYSDPTYTAPRNLIREFLRRIATVNFDVEDVISAFTRKKKRAKYKIYVFGHIHEKRIKKGRKRTFIHPGTWRDEYNFNAKTRELVPRTKRYVEINVIDGYPTYKIVDLPLHRSIFDFDEVIKDELKFIKLAAKEEKYELYF